MKTNVDPSQFETRNVDEARLSDGLSDLYQAGYDVWKMYKNRDTAGSVYYIIVGRLNLDRWKDPAQMKMQLGEA